MAMAGSLCYAGPLPIKTSSKQPTVRSPGAGPCAARNLQLPSLKFAARPSSSTVVAAAASTVGAETQSGAATPAKVLPFRVGHGFDLHRLEPGYPLIIGGINIPHDRGCEAHSDGDVLLHCVVDAILGALGLPDIGQIFPDTDPKWKGAASCVFVEEAVRLMHEAGYELGNLDATLILQRPKLSPHKETMRANLCKLLGADPSVVNLKAKTHEKVDSLGENRSIAAHTVVLLFRK
ncbi:LOW QUALITY PROTEIN: 2-C-methyl-D-erythritol 2,4-cyclodiphosphate synthase, chloroplastic [Salvia miltiorrhiza]|uniref:2-C-methyl-D-erythritol 2,4-cyclodiphosphate synthase n=1 Tax=Salvia miltiorrhiza TaxID=226208 RepID=H6VLE3_SALMI|nr:LOW QUALITY PROTEIN: 2-C-methyl-D-erythritol 2,4-cyclodiphosphate synthase, chloroplastic [Salvia miltiorrhiza]AEZ55667.1 2-C-methyl-D-erythritol 2,4-cyclodiphosphate synthase [Salvia miltiorrhiza]